MGIGAKIGFYGGLDGLGDTPYTAMTTRAPAVLKVVLKAACSLFSFLCVCLAK